jgi:hypothetical protein
MSSGNPTELARREANLIKLPSPSIQDLDRMQFLLDWRKFRFQLCRRELARVNTPALHHYQETNPRLGTPSGLCRERSL